MTQKSNDFDDDKQTKQTVQTEHVSHTEQVSQSDQVPQTEQMQQIQFVTDFYKYIICSFYHPLTNFTPILTPIPASQYISIESEDHQNIFVTSLSSSKGMFTDIIQTEHTIARINDIDNGLQIRYMVYTFTDNITYIIWLPAYSIANNTENICTYMLYLPYEIAINYDNKPYTIKLYKLNM